MGEKRTGLIMTGSRFAQQLLQLTADALDSGRDTQRVHEAAASGGGVEDEKSRGLLPSRPERKSRSESETSPRLNGARQRLSELAMDGELETTPVVVPDVVAVNR